MNNEDFIQLSGPLFEAVQASGIFPDGKTFVDTLPKDSPENILKAFLEKQEAPDFDLKAFVLENFTLPHEEEQSPTETTSMKEYILSMWDILLKEMQAPSPESTLISLPKPHIVPGGRFRECFYWDSYFTALGLAISGQVELMKDMAENFAFLINELGFIPNGNRVYFSSRTQPPYFSFLLELLMEENEEDTALHYFPELEKEYQFWMRGREKLSPTKPSHRYTVLVHGATVLNRYWDKLNIPRPEAYKRETELAQTANNPEFFRSLRAACTSGWDFSSRWLEDETNFESIWTLDLLPIDLNCLMHHLETTLAKFAKKLGHEDKAELYKEAATERKKAIQTLFWDEKEKFFFDYHTPSDSTTKTWSLAAATPLFLNLATYDQAEAVAAHLEKKFLLDGGFATSLKEGKHQWDMPNGWAPLEWIAIKGLVNYGHHALAREAATRWLKLCENTFRKTGKMLEKYNVRECSTNVARGEYELQEGFGWTNGVALALMDLFNFEGEE